MPEYTRVFLLEAVAQKKRIAYKGGLTAFLNPLTPNDHYSGRTAPLTPKVAFYILYSTNIGTEYFKHGIYTPFFLLKMQFVS